MANEERSLEPGLAQEEEDHVESRIHYGTEGTDLSAWACTDPIYLQGKNLLELVTQP